MALVFDESLGFSADSVSEVRAAVAAAWKAAFKSDNTAELNTEPETPAGQIIDSQTASIVQKDSEILYLANMLNPLKATGIFQDALAEIYFTAQARHRVKRGHKVRRPARHGHTRIRPGHEHR